MPSPYTLVAAPVAFTETVNTALLLRGRVLRAAAVAYTLTVNTATLLAGGIVGLVEGAVGAVSFVVTPATAKLRAGLTSYRNIYVPFHQRRRKVVL